MLRKCGKVETVRLRQISIKWTFRQETIRRISQTALFRDRPFFSRRAPLGELASAQPARGSFRTRRFARIRLPNRAVEVEVQPAEGMVRAHEVRDVDRRDLTALLRVTADQYALCTMWMKRQVVGIRIAMPAEHPEVWFDHHLETLRSIIDTAEEAPRLWAAAEVLEHTPRSVFSLAMGALPLLSPAVIKCRCLRTGLKGLALVPSVGPTKEGLFDVGTLYRAGRRQIELEHNVSLDEYEYIYDDDPP